MGDAGASIWIPMIASAVAGGASYENSRQVNKRQDNILAEQIRTGGQRNRQAEALLNETLQRQAGASAEAERASAADQYLGRLQQTSGAAGAGLRQVGRVSDAYTAGAAGAVDDIAAYGQRSADLMSRIDAPIRQRQNEGIDFGRLGSSLGLLEGASASDRYLGDLRMRTVQRDPWLDVLSSAAGAYASSYSPSTGNGSSTVPMQYQPMQYGGVASYGRGRGYLNA